LDLFINTINRQPCLVNSFYIAFPRSGTLVVRSGKRNKQREVPLNTTTRNRWRCTWTRRQPALKPISVGEDGEALDGAGTEAPNRKIHFGWFGRFQRPRRRTEVVKLDMVPSAQ